MEKFHPKHMLVTGAAGFIGCNFVQQQLNLYPTLKIISLDKLTYAGNQDNLPENNEHHLFIKGDINDASLVNTILTEHNIDTIVHFAAESHVDRSIIDPSIFATTNVLGTVQLLTSAYTFWKAQFDLNPAQCRFHHISTDEVYGTLSLEDPSFTEKTPYRPNSPYAASKASSDHFVDAFFTTYQLPITLSNCSNNFGQFQHAEKFIPTVIRACKTQQPIPIYGSGQNIRDWLYVEDHCTAIDKVIREAKIGSHYNIGGGYEIENIQLAQKICAIMDDIAPEHAPHSQLIQHIDDRLGHDFRYSIDNHKISTELNWQPKHTFFEALEKTVHWYYQ